MESVTDDEQHPPRTPRGLKAEGRRLWKSITDEFEVEERNLQLLEIACRSFDRVKALEAEADKTGLTINSPQGLRANPALAEARAYAKQAATILATLKLPGLEDDEEKPKPRAIRGAYRQRGY